jgi:uncharacterized protein
MPIRDAAPVGAPCWVDLATGDTDRARAFYTELFGWTATEPQEEFGGYFQFLHNGVPVGGCMAKGDNPMPDVWSVYLATDDAQKTLDAAAANGGQVVVPAMTVGDLGTMGIVTDPSGATVGLWQPITFQGTGVLAEAGAPGWFELETRDYAAALDFYRNVFRWDTHTVSDSDEMRYTTMAVGEEWYAGVGDAAGWLPEGVPSHWSVYFGADDADELCRRLVSLGGAVVREPEDTPYGRLATATDATGALFKIVAPNDQMPAR